MYLHQSETIKQRRQEKFNKHMISVGCGYNEEVSKILIRPHYFTAFNKKRETN